MSGHRNVCRAELGDTKFQYDVMDKGLAWMVDDLGERALSGLVLFIFEGRVSESGPLERVFCTLGLPMYNPKVQTYIMNRPVADSGKEVRYISGQDELPLPLTVRIRARFSRLGPPTRVTDCVTSAELLLRLCRWKWRCDAFEAHYTIPHDISLSVIASREHWRNLWRAGMTKPDARKHPHNDSPMC